MYRLPDGDKTSDMDVYVDEWNKLSKKVEELFPGYEVIGYNPGFLVSDGKQDTFSLSVKAFNALMTGLAGERP